jgi:organic hydroperoxide reductase OsmC/OhrA
MLFFLFYAAKAGLVVDRYEDDAVGETGKNPAGAVAVLRVRLRPRIAWADNAPTAGQLADLHHRAHESCYIANSVSTEITIEPR